MNGFTSLVTGNMGGGKTLFCVETAFNRALKGGHVFGNVKLNLDAWDKAFYERGLKFDKSRINVFAEEEMDGFYKYIKRGTHSMPVTMIYDEAAINVNARDWNKLERDMFNFNVLVRKMDLHMLYCSQDPSFLDKQIRKLCHKLIDCRSLRDTRLFGVIPFPIPFNVRVYHTLRGGRHVKDYGDLVGPRKHIYPLYDSDALLGKAVQQFCTLGTADASPLERIKRNSLNLGLPCLSALCAGFYSSL